MAAASWKHLHLVFRSCDAVIQVYGGACRESKLGMIADFRSRHVSGQVLRAAGFANA